MTVGIMAVGGNSRDVRARPQWRVASLLGRWDAISLGAVARREMTGETQARFSVLGVPRAVRVRNPGASMAETSVRARGPPQER